VNLLVSDQIQVSNFRSSSNIPPTTL